VTRGVRAEVPVQAYITALTRATRTAAGLTMGAGPRATVALLKASQAAALLDGRAYVTPDDVKSVAVPVMRHRVVVAPELELEGVTPDQALEGVLDSVEAPR
jgi:MoxR-like ATPase